MTAHRHRSIWSGILDTGGFALYLEKSQALATSGELKEMKIAVGVAAYPGMDKDSLSDKVHRDKRDGTTTSKSGSFQPSCSSPLRSV
jgi:hypothetical protein